MLKVTNETKVGAFAAISIVLLILGYNLLKGNDLFERDNIYYSRYHKLDGLLEASPVKVNGLLIGRVVKLELAADTTGDIIATFRLKHTVNIPVGSIARITSADALGTKEVSIDFAKSLTYIKDGDTLKGDLQEGLFSAVSKELLPVKIQAEKLFGSIDSVMVVIKTIFNEKARVDISKSLASIRSTLDNLDKSSGSVDSLIKTNYSRFDKIFGNIESITQNIKSSNKDISNILSNLSATTDSIKRANIGKTLNEVSAAVNEAKEMLEKINSGKGSAGKFVNDQTLYDNLKTASDNLNKLVADLKENPKRYVHFSIFGKKYTAPAKGK